MNPAPENLPVPHPASKLFVDHTGRRFRRLTVVHYAGKKYGSYGAWFCRCDCGKEVTVLATSLVHGLTKSCGCLDRDALVERNTKHGLANSPENKIWQNMRNRCSNPNNRSYKFYGAKGIKVCARWDDFLLFLSDMGPMPSPKHSIDRKDNNGDYCPENCRWASRTEQANNKRTNLVVEIGGVRKTLADWCRDLSLRYAPVIMRLRAGFTPEEAFELVPCERIQKSAKLRVDELR